MPEAIDSLSEGMSDRAEMAARALEQTGRYRVLRRLEALQAGIDRPGSPAASGRSLRVAILDTETTGLSHETDRIIDLGVVVLDVDGASGQLLRVVHEWQGLEDPGVAIPPNIVALTGITTDMVRDHVLPDTVVRDLFEGVEMVIAHSAGFDRPFVEARFPWMEKFPWVCSIKDIDWRQEGMGSSKLEFLAYRAGFFFDGHRALIDCQALARVLLDTKLHSTGLAAMATLLHACEDYEYIVEATNAPFERKDDLKAAGYFWDAEARVWKRTIIGDGPLDDEFIWLRANVYNNRTARVQVEFRSAEIRFSKRAGPKDWRSLGPHGDSSRTMFAGGRGKAY